MKFEKWQGLGNDFVIVEVEKNPDLSYSTIAAEVCDRHRGIGADGLVTLQNIGEKKLRMRIYNSDGTEIEMCGNATRCAGNYLRQQGLKTGEQVELLTGAGWIKVSLLYQQMVTVDMGKPVLGEQDVKLQGVIGSVVSMGNPHFVIFTEDLKKYPQNNRGRP